MTQSKDESKVHSSFQPSVTVLTWHTGKNPYHSKAVKEGRISSGYFRHASAVLKGNNVGHAALKFTLPDTPEIRAELSAMEEVMSINPSFSYVGSKTENGNYKREVQRTIDAYFSFWPGSGDYYQKQQNVISDKLFEQTKGNEMDEIDFTNPDDKRFHELISTSTHPREVKKDNIINSHLNQLEGQITILEINQEKIHQNLNLISNRMNELETKLHRYKNTNETELLENIRSASNRIKELKAELGQCENDDELKHIINESKTMSAEMLKLNTELEEIQQLKNEINFEKDRGMALYDELNTNLREIEQVKEEIKTEQDRINYFIDSNTQNIGLNPSSETTLPLSIDGSEPLALNLPKMIEQMKEVYDSGYYQFLGKRSKDGKTGHNCSSSVMSIVQKGISQQLREENVAGEKIVKRKSLSEKPHTILTPKAASHQAQVISNLITTIKHRQIKEKFKTIKSERAEEVNEEEQLNIKRPGQH